VSASSVVFLAWVRIGGLKPRGWLRQSAACWKGSPRTGIWLLDPGCPSGRTFRAGTPVSRETRPERPPAGGWIEPAQAKTLLFNILRSFCWRRRRGPWRGSSAHSSRLARAISVTRRGLRCAQFAVDQSFQRKRLAKLGEASVSYATRTLPPAGEPRACLSI